jgi:hypothetical protein
VTGPSDPFRPARVNVTVRGLASTGGELSDNEMLLRGNRITRGNCAAGSSAVPVAPLPPSAALRGEADIEAGGHRRNTGSMLPRLWRSTGHNGWHLVRCEA